MSAASQANVAAVTNGLGFHQLLIRTADGLVLPQMGLATALSNIESRMGLIEELEVEGTVKGIKSAFQSADKYIMQTKDEMDGSSKTVQTNVNEIQDAKKETHTSKRGISTQWETMEKK